MVNAVVAVQDRMLKCNGEKKLYRHFATTLPDPVRRSPLARQTIVRVATRV